MIFEGSGLGVPGLLLVTYIFTYNILDSAIISSKTSALFIFVLNVDKKL